MTSGKTPRQFLWLLMTFTVGWLDPFKQNFEALWGWTGLQQLLRKKSWHQSRQTGKKIKSGVFEKKSFIADFSLLWKSRGFFAKSWQKVFMAKYRSVFPSNFDHNFAYIVLKIYHFWWTLFDSFISFQTEIKKRRIRVSVLRWLDNNWRLTYSVEETI